MEPRIQYAKTSDGVSIAFWTLGEGEPVVYIPGIPWSHIQLEWEVPPLRRVYEMYAHGRRLIGYDARGTGSSDRDVSDFSLDAHLRDLEAVVERLHPECFVLSARGYGANIAVAYAVRNPERVSRMVLATPRPGFLEESHDSALAGVFRALRKAVRHAGDFRIMTETVAHEILGWEAGEEARRFAAFLRECTSHEAALAIFNAMEGCDITDLLTQVRHPTLVIGIPNPWYPPLEAARWVASQIPGARLVVVDRTPGVPAFEDIEMVERVGAAIDEFLAEGEPVGAKPVPAVPSAFRTVLFTDLVGHTEMMSRLGDERGRAVLREHERITREVLKAHGGTEVKTMGDGFMASFGSVTRAVECGIALQRAVDARNMEQGTGNMGERLEVRCGLNAGEPIEEDGDLFGATVILAARIAAKAEGGEILVANAVRELCSGKGFLFADRGEFAAKGFEEPVRVYEVRWQERS